MSETRKLTTILAADVVGYSRLTGAEEELTLARLRALRSDLIDPLIAVHHGRVFKRTGDGSLIEFRSVVDAVRCAIEVQNGMVVRNSGLPPEKRIEFRVGIHLGDVMEETDGDLLGDGVNIAARLEGIAKPGAICLSEDAYRQVKARLDLAVTDLGDTELKNIAEPVHVFSVEVGKPAQAKRAEPNSQLQLESSAPRLSVVVLPFANIGGDPEQEYFVDGVTESLTTDLSRIAGSFVIARNTAFTYKGRSVDVKQIGRELKVRYALEGSVQRGSNRLRINVQLIDTENGAHLWAERFDRPIGDLFDMQDEIVARLARQLDSELIAAEAHRAERAPTPDSMDLYFQGLAYTNRGWTPQYLARARHFFERAQSLDPGNIEAVVGLAHVDVLVGVALFADDRPARLAEAEAAMTSALSQAPNHAFAHYVLGVIYVFTKRMAQGIAQCEQALALDRNLAPAHSIIGIADYLDGRAEETEGHIQEALRLSPRDIYAFQWMAVAGVAKLFLGKDQEAVVRLRRAIDINRNWPIAHFWLAAAQAQLGRLEEARAAATAGLALDPTFSIRRLRAGAATDNPAARVQGKRVSDGLRLAGVPEG